MDAGEFYDRVEAHPELEGVGLEDEGSGCAVCIRHVPSDSKYRLELPAIGEHSWETLEAILTGRREPKILSHMTRVVGYFSKIENWNRSKIGELKGRRLGDYSLKTDQR